MKAIDRGEVMGLADYETVREPFRARVIAEKRRRRVPVGPKASAVFENRDTVLLQIQEMLRIERITRPSSIQHEIDTYNDLVPAADELSCTIMIEIDDRTERDAFLQAAKGLEKHVWLVAASRRLPARTGERWADGLDDRTTALHYLKFGLPKDLADALRSRSPPVDLALEIDHPAYQARAKLPPDTVAALGEDMEE
ncbi:MAG TPA: DUF3501 family protein [Polyangiaceae bacterium]|jgi:hypothetical protein